MFILFIHAYKAFKGSATSAWRTINGAKVLINKAGTVIAGPENLMGMKFQQAVRFENERTGNDKGVPYPTKQEPLPEAIAGDKSLEVVATRHKVNGQVRYYKEFFRPADISGPAPGSPVLSRGAVYTKGAQLRQEPKLVHRQLISRNQAEAFQEGIAHGKSVTVKPPVKYTTIKVDGKPTPKK